MGKISRTIIILIINFVFALLAHYINCSVDSDMYSGIAFCASFLICYLIFSSFKKNDIYFFSICILCLTEPFFFYNGYVAMFSSIIFTVIFICLFSKHEYSRLNWGFIIIVSIAIAIFYYLIFFNISSWLFIGNSLRKFFASLGLLICNIGSTWCCDFGIIIFTFNFLLLSTSFIYITYSNKNEKTSTSNLSS
jgi:hypothetical protein